MELIENILLMVSILSFSLILLLVMVFGGKPQVFKEFFKQDKI